MRSGYGTGHEGSNSLLPPYAVYRAIDDPQTVGGRVLLSCKPRRGGGDTIFAIGLATTQESWRQDYMLFQLVCCDALAQRA